MDLVTDPLCKERTREMIIIPRAIEGNRIRRMKRAGIRQATTVAFLMRNKTKSLRPCVSCGTSIDMLWTVAAVQTKIDDDIAKNVHTILHWIERAAKKKANIVCFPEICLISNEHQARSVAPEQKLIAEAAKKHGMHVIFGTYMLDKEKKIRNRIIVIDKNGQSVMRYSKKYLFHQESKDVVAGKRNKTFVLDGVRCAVINCWDYAFPEHIRKLASQGTDVIFCPSYLLSHPDTSAVLEKVPQVRAFDTMSYFVMVDGVAPETFKRTKICHPLRCIGSIKEKEGMVVATIDTDEIVWLREKYKNLQQFKAVSLPAPDSPVPAMQPEPAGVA